jgi:hypothetical protein
MQCAKKIKFFSMPFHLDDDDDDGDEDADEQCTCEACASEKQRDEEDDKLDGTRCRKCDKFYHMATPDYEKLDKKLTCWACKNMY